MGLGILILFLIFGSRKTVIMKYLASFAAMALLLVSGCGTTRLTSQEKLAEKQRVAQLVRERLDARSFQVDFDYVIPFRGSGKSLTSRYSITVDGNTLDSYLPYFGVAQSLPYGGGKGLIFKEEIGEYSDEMVKKDRRVIRFSVNNQEDILVYILTVFDNGKADLDVHSFNRDDISFRGCLHLP